MSSTRGGARPNPEGMGPSPRQFVRAVLPLGVALGCLLSGYAGEVRKAPPVKARAGYPVTPPAAWRPPNLVDMKPAELAERMGFGSRIDGLLRGQPEETERFYWEDGDEVHLLSGWSGRQPVAPPPEVPVPVDPAAARALVRAEAAAGAPPPEEPVGPDFGPPRPAPMPLTPEAVEASVADILALYDEDEDYDPRAPPDPEALDRYMRRKGLDGGFRMEQSAAGGFQDSEYSSVANGSTTTESRYLEHHILATRALDDRSDLLLRNDFLADILKIRNTSSGTWSKHVDSAGRLEASLSFTRQDSDQSKGEVEPDHNLGGFSVSGGREVADGLSWDVTGYGSSLDYSGRDTFYLDRRQLGLGVTGSYTIGPLELYGRHVLEQDRYPDGPTNDADRILSEISVVSAPRRDIDVEYTSRYEREGILVQTDLDSFRVWTTEGVVRKYFGDPLAFSLTIGKRSQSVDQLSQFLFDNREYYLWPEVEVQVSSTIAARLGYRDAAVRNRPKAPAGFPVSERIDDRDVNDWEFGVEYYGPVFDASFLGYLGRIRHVNGEQEAFASFDRSGLAITVGFRAGRFGRGEFTHTEDAEEYTTFAVNDNHARTTGARYVLQF